MGPEEALPGSGDADPFVDCDEGSSAIELARRRGDARGPLGAEMDVTTRERLDPLIRDRVVASAEKVFRRPSVRRSGRRIRLPRTRGSFFTRNRERLY